VGVWGPFIHRMGGNEHKPGKTFDKFDVTGRDG
jgi:hypothetical protein